MNSDADLDGSDWARTTDALRRVARSVGASVGEAEDVAQGALLAGLLERARGLTPGLGWLKTQARHRTIDGLRQHRHARRSPDAQALEEQTAETPAPPEMALQFEVQRRVMAAVESLPEPYRETVFLRYFEGVSVPEIARRKGAPVPTVRTWLTRAHKRLREQLLESDEGRSPAWIAAFLDFGGGPSGALVPSPVPLGTSTGPLFAASLLMSFKTLFIAVGVLVALGLGYRLTSTQLATERPGPVVQSVEEPELELGPRVAAVEEEREREALPVAESTAPVAPMTLAPAPEWVEVHGRVLDGLGQPLAGFSVRVEPPLKGLRGMTTSKDGRMSGEATLIEGSRSEVVPAREGSVVLFHREISAYYLEQGLGALLVVAPEGSLHGSVQGTDGEPIEGASIQLKLPSDFSARFDERVGSAGLYERWSTSSSAHGSFELIGAPSLAGCSMTVTANGYKAATIEGVCAIGDRAGAEPLAIVLESIDPLRIVSGVVLDPHGDAVAHAWVALGNSVKQANDTGRFKFELDNDERALSGAQRLLASANGWAPVEFSPDLPQASDPSGEGVGNDVTWPEYVELRFQRESLSIEGVVLDREGEAAPGHCVWVDDMTEMGTTSNGSPFMTEAPGSYLYGLHKRYETDAEGRFRIDHLSPRNYKLVAMNPQTLFTSPQMEIAAGDSSAVIRYDASHPVVDLVGRVVNRSGHPVEGATLRWGRVAIQIGTNVDMVSTDPVGTGADGMFAFSDVPLDSELNLQIDGSGLWGLRVPVTEIDEPYDDVVFTLGVTCEAKIFADIDGDTGGIASCELRDETGEPMMLSYSPKPGSYTGAMSIPVVDGVSFLFRASDAAMEVAYLDSEGRVVSTQAISLVQGELNEIQR